MDKETKGKVVKSMKWSGVEMFTAQAIQFVIGILIARQLLPSDYGLIGMLAIFMAVSQAFADSGFGSALIQKKNPTPVDYSTAFIFNIGISSLMYVVLFFCAPYIASFYNQPLLTSITRIYALSLIITGATQVQNAILQKKLEFKNKAKITIASVAISGVVGIIMAYTDFGVWALVAQGLTSSIITSLMLWYFIKWRPSFKYSKESFCQLFGYGGKLLGSTLINTVYNNISTIIIGKAYQSADLGYYTRARNFAVLPTSVITNLVMRVNFPILAQLQDDNEKLLSTYKVILRTAMFLLVPILLGMASVSQPMIRVLLGDKWLGCVTMLIILCIGNLWNPLTSINLNLLYVKGRTDLVLKLELIKKPIAFVMMFAAIPFGIYGMCIAIALYDFVAFCFNCHYTGKILNYGFFPQVKLLLPIFGYGILMALIVVASIWFIHQPIIKLTIGILVGILSYMIMARWSNDSTYNSLINLLKEKMPASIGKYL